MRRALVVVAVLALLGGSCADRADLPSGLASTLQDRVASIREAAEAGRPGIAIDRLNILVDLVSTGLDDGSIDQARALEILEAAQAVQSQLALLPPPSSSPSPSQVEENGHGEGKGKDEDKGHGNEGNGND